MSGIKNDNYPYFDLTEEELKKILPHVEIINPANIGRALIIPPGLTEDQIYKLYLKEAIKGLLECDTIYLLKGWEKSNGAVFEFNIAVKLGYKVLYE